MYTGSGRPSVRGYKTPHYVSSATSSRQLSTPQAHSLKFKSFLYPIQNNEQLLSSSIRLEILDQLQSVCSAPKSWKKYVFKSQNHLKIWLGKEGPMFDKFQIIKKKHKYNNFYIWIPRWCGWITRIYSHFIHPLTVHSVNWRHLVTRFCRNTIYLIFV